MSLRNRVNKLIEKRKISRQKNYFIIAHSKEDEEVQIEKIKLENNIEDSIITVFKLYA